MKLQVSQVVSFPSFIIAFFSSKTREYRSHFRLFSRTPYENQHIASIEAVQGNFLRLVTGDYSRYSSEHKWERPLDGRHLSAGDICYKSINNLIYLPIPSSVRPADPRTRSKHPVKFRHIATNTNAYKYSFFPRTIPLWNNLPSFYSRHCYQSWSPWNLIYTLYFCSF